MKSQGRTTAKSGCALKSAQTSSALERRDGGKATAGPGLHCQQQQQQHVVKATELLKRVAERELTGSTVGERLITERLTTLPDSKSPSSGTTAASQLLQQHVVKATDLLRRVAEKQLTGSSVAERLMMARLAPLPDSKSLSFDTTVASQPAAREPKRYTDSCAATKKSRGLQRPYTADRSSRKYSIPALTQLLAGFSGLPEELAKLGCDTDMLQPSSPSFLHDLNDVSICHTEAGHPPL